MRFRLLLSLSPLTLLLGCPGACDVYSPPSIESAEIANCKLLEQSQQRQKYGHLSSGFPLLQQNLKNEGNFLVAVLPIDFDDVPGDENFLQRIDEQMKLTTDWYHQVSAGRVQISWKVHDSWIRVPGSSIDFALDRSRSDDDRLALTALRASDPYFDFTGVSSVNFLLPAGQTFMAEGVQGFKHSQFGYAGHRTDEGPIYNYTLAGKYFDAPYRTLWSYWAHEMGHMFGMPDLYNVGSQWWNGEKFPYENYPFSGFDMMSSQDGPSRTLSSWIRFVFGWLDDDQVYCQSASEISSLQVTLVPLDGEGDGYRSIVLPTSSSSAIVIDSRRPDTKFDCPGTGEISSTWRGRTGVLVYTIDLTLGHSEGFAKPVVPSGRSAQRLESCSAPEQLDALLQPGDSVDVSGLTITVLSSGNFDTVSISQNS